MVRFDKISVTEKNYPYVDAVVAADYKNGTFGTVTEGKFTAGATGTFVIMKKGSHARIGDLTTVVGAVLNVTSAQLPANVEKGNKLESQVDGTLKVNASAKGTYLEVVEVTSFGANVKVVTATANV